MNVWVKVQQRLLELETRNRIYQHVRQVPGVHLRRMSSELGFSVSTLEYHLRIMERHGLVVSRRQGRRRTYFPYENLDRRDQQTLFFLRAPTARRILVELTRNPGLANHELALKLGLGQPTLCYHLKRLMAGSLVSPVRIGRVKRYVLLEPERVNNLLRRFAGTYRNEDGTIDPMVGFNGGQPHQPTFEDPLQEAPVAMADSLDGLRSVAPRALKAPLTR